MLFVVQVKTGSALSLLSVIYIRAEATDRIMGTAVVPLRADRFSAEKLFFFCEIFDLDVFSIGKYAGSMDKVQCSLKIVFTSGL